MDKEKVINNRKLERLEDLNSPPQKRLKEDVLIMRSPNTRSRNDRRSCRGPLANVFSTKSNSLLPITYSDLLEVFISLDVIVNKLINNHEYLYIDRIKDVLKQMNKNEFNAQVFGQILTVFPESYRYEFDPSPLDVNLHNDSSLQIAPNLNFGTLNDSSPRKSVKSMSLSQLILRKNTFKERLLTLVKEKHDEFLIYEKKMTLEDVKSLKIIRWSSDFDVNGVGTIPSIKFVKNSKCLLESPLKSMTLAVDKVPSLCKDLFGKLKKDNGNIKEEINVVKKANRKSQAQLSYSAKDGKKNEKEKMVLSPRKLAYKLPFHMNALLDLFTNVDKTVQALLQRGEMIYLTRVLKTVSLTKTYNETHFGQLITIYPDAYSLRWERVLNKVTLKTTNKMDIVITPQLKNDGTKVSITSPDKGYINFDCVRLAQRRQQFIDRCIAIVEKCHQDFNNKSTPNIVFNADLHVDMIQSSPLPDKPVVRGGDIDTKVITSIADLFGIIKKRHENDLKDTEIKKEIVDGKLKTLPQSLLDKVRQNKENKYLFAKNNIDVNRRQILEELPEMLRIIMTEFRIQSAEGPLQLDYVRKIVCGNMAMTERVFDEHLAVINQEMPGVVEILDWSTPCIKLGPATLTIGQIQHRVSVLLNRCS